MKNLKKNLWIYGIVLLIVFLVLSKVITGKMIMICFLVFLGLMAILFAYNYYTNTLSQVKIAKRDSMIKNDQIESYKKKVEMENKTINDISVNYDVYRQNANQKINELQDDLSKALDAYKELKRTQYMEDYVPTQDNVFGEDVPTYIKMGIVKAITEANIQFINDKYPDPTIGSYFLIKNDPMKVIVFNGIGWVIMKRMEFMM